jgi:hypothetical protein
MSHLAARASVPRVQIPLGCGNQRLPDLRQSPRRLKNPYERREPGHLGRRETRALSFPQAPAQVQSRNVYSVSAQSLMFKVNARRDDGPEGISDYDEHHRGNDQVYKREPTLLRKSQGERDRVECHRGERKCQK